LQGRAERAWFLIRETILPQWVIRELKRIFGKKFLTTIKILNNHTASEVLKNNCFVKQQFFKLKWK